MRPDGPALKTWPVTVTDGVTEEVHTVLSAAKNHGLRYVMQVLAAAARGDEDAVRELADLDADAQG